MRRLAAFFFLSVFLGCSSSRDPAQLQAEAQRIAHQIIILDTHIDLPYRLWRKWEDVSQTTEKGDFDYPRARAGGLDAAFLSIYIPAEYQEKGGAKALADSLIDLVESLVQRWPDKFSLATSIENLRANFAAGKISFLMGMENGAAIEGSLANVDYFYKRGVRYITLTHAKDNDISDSSYDTTGTWGGLSPLGRKVVAEMNRVGMIIDVSHLSDQAFYDVLALSKAPVVATHSSCRHFTPGWQRNMSDEMIERLAEKGGVIQINFGSTFLKRESREAMDRARDEIGEYLKSHGLRRSEAAARKYIESYFHEHPPLLADVTDAADHIDHVVRLVGVEHVGIGSDFEGVGETVPRGLEDVSRYPNLIAELLRRGYEEGEIEKICSGNFIRLWQEVDRVARSLRRGASTR